MSKSTQDSPELRDGSEWIDHEDYIIGNEAGIRRLREACDVALREGSYSGNDLGDWVGVKRVESAWFQNRIDSKSTRFANWVLGGVLLGLFASCIVGLTTIVAWLFR
jgi:hypothetical protein